MTDSVRHCVKRRDSAPHHFCILTRDDISQLRDVTMVEPLSHRPYGQTEFVIRDPNGYALVFAEPD